MTSHKWKHFFVNICLALFTFPYLLGMPTVSSVCLLHGHFQEKPKMFAKDQEINHEAVTKKLYEIIAARGKKGTDRSQMIEMLQELKQVAEVNNLGPAMHVKILFNITAAIFDYNPNIATCMRPEMWDMWVDWI